MNRSAVALAFLVSLSSACAAPAPVRRDVVIGLIGEPASVFADDPGARVIADGTQDGGRRTEGGGEGFKTPTVNVVKDSR